MVTIWLGLGLGLLACNYAISYSHFYFVLCPFDMIFSLLGRMTYFYFSFVNYIQEKCLLY